jgi:hypothetical protein
MQLQAGHGVQAVQYSTRLLQAQHVTLQDHCATWCEAPGLMNALMHLAQAQQQRLTYRVFERLRSCVVLPTVRQVVAIVFGMFDWVPVESWMAFTKEQNH